MGFPERAGGPDAMLMGIRCHIRAITVQKIDSMTDPWIEKFLELLSNTKLCG
jgi:hypothetical protein